MRLVSVAALAIACTERRPPAKPPEPWVRHVADAHVHVAPTEIDRLHSIMDETGVEWVLNLSGLWPGGPLEQQLRAAEESGRILVAMNLPWGAVRMRPDDFPMIAADMIREGKRLGARALKIEKALGLAVPKPDGTGLLAVDDPWLDPIWKAAGEAGLPIVIHTGDPKAFWLPMDDENERIEELRAHPRWSNHGEPVPSFDALLAQLMNVVARHPRTTFVAVHFGNNAEDPAWVGRMLDRHPNLYVDIAARIPEIGRHAAADVRSVFLTHSGRILFGTDLGVSPREFLMLGSFGEEPSQRSEVLPFFSAHYRWLETADSFPSPTPIQGRWNIHGLDLPEDVLDRIYSGNAARLFGPPPKRSTDRPKSTSSTKASTSTKGR
jgi:predicted TIM-barrel fold metal-dependent hydrolase